MAKPVELASIELYEHSVKNFRPPTNFDEQQNTVHLRPTATKTCPRLGSKNEVDVITGYHHTQAA
jgi:hypothetical protein